MSNDILISLSLYFNEEQMKGKGEDSSVRITNAPNAALIATMDGCGGAGAKIYEKANNVSGARISAEHVAIALHRWFSKNQYGLHGTGGKSAEALAAEIKLDINNELAEQYKILGEEESGVKSRLARILPCTLAAVFAEVIETNQIRCISFWAGDSRTYVFRTCGLQQTSRDDIRGQGDPFDALMNDSRLSNLVSLSADYVIHASETMLTEPCIVLTASDGCFSYFKSPMEFEWALLDTLKASQTPQQWETNLRSLFGAYASDDFTMNIAILGFYNWTAVRNAYLPRWHEFEEQYYKPMKKYLSEADLQAHYALWLKYKQKYLLEDGSL